MILLTMISEYITRGILTFSLHPAMTRWYKRSVTGAMRFAISVAAVITLCSTDLRIIKSQENPDGCGGYPVNGQSFDNVNPPALPLGWVATNAIDPDGIFWVTSDSGNPSPPADSLPNAAFINDPTAISDKRLDSPSMITGQDFIRLSFRNNFSLPEGFDGGVLEVSFDGVTFQDVAAVGGSFVLGGYNGTISTCCGNPLAGRQAWTGNSGGFITTIVCLPTGGLFNTWLRWRMGSDINGRGQGWRIDSLVVEGDPKPPTPTATPTARPTPRPRPTPTPRSRPTPLPRQSPPFL